jgi:hypothetical protein
VPFSVLNTAAPSGSQSVTRIPILRQREIQVEGFEAGILGHFGFLKRARRRSGLPFRRISKLPGISEPTGFEPLQSRDKLRRRVPRPLCHFSALPFSPRKAHFASNLAITAARGACSLQSPG